MTQARGRSLNHRRLAGLKWATYALIPTLAVLTTLALPTNAGAQSTTLYVAAGGSNTSNNCATQATPCATVSYALTQAASGATINVSGTIVDHITVGPPFGETITISGANAPASSPAVITGNGSGTVLTVLNTTVTLNDLTIQQGSGATGGIEVEGGLTLNSSTLTATAGPGIDETGGSSLSVNNSTIADNSGPGTVRPRSRSRAARSRETRVVASRAGRPGPLVQRVVARPWCRTA